MIEPASGPVAASAAVGAVSGAIFGVGTFLPPGASFNEFLWGCVFAIFGAFAYQFIKAQVRRQKAEGAGIPLAERPKIDVTTVGYAMLGAPMASACLIFAIHQLQGLTGFGNLNWAQSAAGFMVAGAAGPEFVAKVVGALIAAISSKTGGK